MLPTPAKFNMEPEKDGFQKEYPGVWFSGSTSKLQGCSIGIFLDPAPKDSNSGIQCIEQDDKGVPSQDSDDDFPIYGVGDQTCEEPFNEAFSDLTLELQLALSAHDCWHVQTENGYTL